MIMAARKTRFSKRVGMLNKELSTVDSRIRKIEREIERHGGRPAVPSASVRRASAPMVPRVDDASLPADAPMEGDAFPLSAMPPPVVGMPPRLPDRELTPERAAPRDDDQFASYFMSGGLKGTQAPVRQDRKVQRAKVLFLLLCFVLLLFALLFFRVWR